MASVKIMLTGEAERALSSGIVLIIITLVIAGICVLVIATQWGKIM
jgi:hypothetical protein